MIITAASHPYLSVRTMNGQKRVDILSFDTRTGLAEVFIKEKHKHDHLCLPRCNQVYERFRAERIRFTYLKFIDKRVGSVFLEYKSCCGISKYL